jgi:tetratricopeptide (TPR) repeat protein
MKANEKVSNNASYCDNLGLAFYHLHDLEQALKYLDKAIELDANIALSHFHRGLVFLDNRDF